MNNETIKNYGKSIRSKLLNISKKEGVFQSLVLRILSSKLAFIN